MSSSLQYSNMTRYNNVSIQLRNAQINIPTVSLDTIVPLRKSDTNIPTDKRNENCIVDNMKNLSLSQC